MSVKAAWNEAEFPLSLTAPVTAEDEPLRSPPKVAGGEVKPPVMGS
jgi:hypothetical protein